MSTTWRSKVAIPSSLLFQGSEHSRKLESRERGVQFGNGVIKKVISESQGNQILTDRICIKKTLVMCHNIALDRRKRRVKRGHRNPNSIEISRARNSRQRARRYEATHCIEALYKVVETIGLFQSSLYHFETSVNTAQHSNTGECSDLAISILRVPSSSVLLAILVKRQQHCKEGDDRCDPSPHRRDSSPVQVAFIAPLDAWNQILKSTQLQFPLLAYLHSAMGPNRKMLKIPAPRRRRARLP